MLLERLENLKTCTVFPIGIGGSGIILLEEKKIGCLRASCCASPVGHHLTPRAFGESRRGFVGTSCIDGEPRWWLDLAQSPEQVPRGRCGQGDWTHDHMQGKLPGCVGL